VLRQRRRRQLLGVHADPHAVLRLLRVQAELHDRRGVLRLWEQRLVHLHLQGRLLGMLDGPAYAIIAAPLAALLAWAQTGTG
jgi:hypothetical protein